MNLAGLVYYKSFIHDESCIYFKPQPEIQEEIESSGSGPMCLAGPVYNGSFDPYESFDL